MNQPSANRVGRMPNQATTPDKATGPRLAWHWTGRALIGIGLIHQIVGVITAWLNRDQIFQAGWLNQAKQSFEFQTMVWFLLAGVLIILLGLVVNYLNTTLARPAPAWLGWWLVAVSVLALVLMPASGFWLVLALGIWVILAARNAPLPETGI